MFDVDEAFRVGGKADELGGGIGWVFLCGSTKRVEVFPLSVVIDPS